MSKAIKKIQEHIFSLNALRDVNKQKLLALTAILLLSLCRAAIIHYSTYWGPRAGSDSVAYIVAARNLLKGHGLTVTRASGRLVPLSYRPPMYSLVLGGIGFLGLDLIAAARWLNIILFALTIFLVGLGFYLLTRSIWFSIATSAFVLTSPFLIDNFTQAMSEPLFFFAGIAGIFLLLLYLDNRKSLYLIAAALATGVAFTTRYMGAALILAGLVVLVLFRRCSWKLRVKDAFIYSVLASIPMALWLIWFYSQPIAGMTSVYDFEVGNIWGQLEPFRVTLVERYWAWLPFTQLVESQQHRHRLLVLGSITLIEILLITIALVKMWRSDDKDPFADRGIQLMALLATFIIAFIALFAFSYVFVVYPKPALYDRIQSPGLMAWMILHFLVAYVLCRAWPSRKLLHALPILIASALIASSLSTSLEMVEQLHQKGGGLTGMRWHQSEVLEAVKELPPEILIISNEPDAILLHTDRPAYSIPELSETEPGATFFRFGDDLNDGVQRIFRQEGAALVLFEEFYWQLAKIYTRREVDERLNTFVDGLNIYRTTEDGTIYFFPD